MIIRKPIHNILAELVLLPGWPPFAVRDVFGLTPERVIETVDGDAVLHDDALLRLRQEVVQPQVLPVARLRRRRGTLEAAELCLIGSFRGLELELIGRFRGLELNFSPTSGFRFRVRLQPSSGERRLRSSHA